jgi:Integrase core domain
VLCVAAHNTYIPTWQGWLYLATIIDCFNKEVVGYALADHMRTELVTDALVAIQQGATAGGCQAPVVNRRVRASMLSIPHLRAVDR